MPSDLPSFSDPVALARQVGITASGVVHRNLSVEALYEIAVQTGQATVMSNGALRQLTAPFFGRAAQSSFYVNDPAIRVQGRSLDELIAWGDPEQGEWDNLPISSDVWNDLYARVVEHLNSAPRLCLCDGHSARTERTRLNVRVVTDRAVGALFSKNIFLRPSDEQLVGFVPGWTILHAPDVRADPDHGTHTSAFVITHIGLRTTIIGGTRYNGQIKKAIFAVQNLLLPLRGILTMHAGASEGQGGRAAIHAGLSGTGKTTLSNTGFPVADDQIIVDTDADEHEVITNMEGGQYA
ncbi:MAG: phosphoenolpyruvate carboxykinase (ATP), partial [Kiritimatiellia bacterium]